MLPIYSGKLMNSKVLHTEELKNHNKPFSGESQQYGEYMPFMGRVYSEMVELTN